MTKAEAESFSRLLVKMTAALHLLVDHSKKQTDQIHYLTGAVEKLTKREQA